MHKSFQNQPRSEIPLHRSFILCQPVFWAETRPDCGHVLIFISEIPKTIILYVSKSP
jgi:hypothetical protein